MQTLTLDNLPAPVLLVWGLPEGSINPVASMGYLSAKVPNEANYCHVDTMADPVKLQKWLDTHKDEDDYKQEIWKIPEGEWKLIGKLSELTEEQAKGLVHISIHTGLSAHYVKGVNPPNVYCYDDSLGSFHSAIEAEGYFVVNPVPPFHERGKEWQDAQSKTLPASTLIFKRL